jgi:hypothetical protein
MTVKAPWWASVLIALLQVAKVKFPDLASYIEALQIGLTAHFGFDLLGQANVQRALANEQRAEGNRALAVSLRGSVGGAGGAAGVGGTGGAGGAGGAGGERGAGGRFGAE